MVGSSFQPARLTVAWAAGESPAMGVGLMRLHYADRVDSRTVQRLCAAITRAGGIIQRLDYADCFTDGDETGLAILFRPNRADAAELTRVRAACLSGAMADDPADAVAMTATIEWAGG